jgi:TatD DNase family protein
MSIRYLDTHAHLNLAQFDHDRDAVIQKNCAAGVAVINVGTRRETSELAVELARAHHDMWAVVGVHPLNVVTADPDDHGASEPEQQLDYAFYNALARDPKTVGVGECGFDYFHHSDDTYALQREVFLAQIALANEVKKPLMLHLRNSNNGVGRNAYDDALDILRTEAKVRGNAHFFAGTTAQIKQFLELGFTVSFTGVLTFAKAYEELVAYTPLDMLHAETDCPYVAPLPYRGQRCEPWMVVEVYKTIAAIKGVSEDVVSAVLRNNARSLYGIERA